MSQVVSPTSRILAVLGAVLALIAAACGPADQPATTGSAAPAEERGTIRLSPPSGPSGTTVGVSVQGAQPGVLVTITYGAGTESATADDAGDASASIVVEGPEGSDVRVTAFDGNMLELASATFRVTGPPPESSLPETTTSTTPTTSTTIPDPGPPVPEVVVTVTPASGPAGERATISVSGPPDSPVTLKINQVGQSAGRTDADGVYTFETTFSGDDGAVIPVEATAGVGAAQGSGSATYTITPSVPPPTTAPGGPPPADDPNEDITLRGDDLVLTANHDTVSLNDELLGQGALSVVQVQNSTALTPFEQLVLVLDTNGSGVLDDGDVIPFPSQPIVPDAVTDLPIDMFGTYFLAALPDAAPLPPDAIGAPMIGIQPGSGGATTFDGAGAASLVFAEGPESGTATAWIVDSSEQVSSR